MLLYGTTTGLSKIPAVGGSAQQVVAAAQLVGADRADDGTILFSIGVILCSERDHAQRHDGLHVHTRGAGAIAAHLD